MLAPGTQEKIRLKTNNGKTGYKITKFQLMCNTPGAVAYEYLGKINKISDPNSSLTTVDFTDSKLMAVAYIKGNAGGDGNGHQNTIDFILIASEGNAVDFGDTTQTHTELMGSSCNSVRMLIAGGNSPGQSPMNDIDYITIATAGNGTDYGDLARARRGPSSLSDSHGGLGGGF